MGIPLKSDLFKQIMDHLTQASIERSPFTLMQLATINSKNEPKLRTIVLRDFNAEKAIISFFTDTRSQKIEEINNNHKVALVAFDPKGIQLRIEGEANIIQDTQTKKEAWHKLKQHTHLLFKTSVSPGKKIASPHEVKYIDEEYGNKEPSIFFDLIDIHITSLEWLDLNENPHIRCFFEKDKNGEWQGQWLAP